MTACEMPEGSNAVRAVCDPPPDHTDGEDTAWTKAGCKPSRRNLKACVPDEEGAEDPTEPLIAETIFAADLQACDRYVGAVEKRDTAENEKPESQEKPNPGTTLSRHQMVLLVVSSNHLDEVNGHVPVDLLRPFPTKHSMTAEEANKDVRNVRSNHPDLNIRA
jgi:hypothetical protein